MIRRTLSLTLLAACAVLIAGCTATSPTSQEEPASGAQPPASSTPQVILLVDENRTGWTDMAFSGEVKLNEFGCVTLDDALVIAPGGSSITVKSAEDIRIHIDGYDDIKVGEFLNTGGGLGTIDLATNRPDLTPPIETCLSPDATSVDTAWIAPQNK